MKSYNRLRNIWSGVKQRCLNPKNPLYKYYGGRGIEVCADWMGGFSSFEQWAKQSGYSDNLTIERIDVNGRYEPANCTWIPLKDQMQNRRSTKSISAFGETKLLKDWTSDPRCVVSRDTIYSRLRRNINPETALTVPTKPGRRSVKSGHTGVSYMSRFNRWRVRIKGVDCGWFKTKNDAVAMAALVLSRTDRKCQNAKRRHN